MNEERVAQIITTMMEKQVTAIMSMTAKHKLHRKGARSKSKIGLCSDNPRYYFLFALDTGCRVQ